MTNRLPDPLKDLSDHNAVTIRNDPDFSADMAKVSRAIAELKRTRQNPRPVIATTRAFVEAAR